jgi:hypothetical protein
VCQHSVPSASTLAKLMLTLQCPHFASLHCCPLCTYRPWLLERVSWALIQPLCQRSAPGAKHITHTVVYPAMLSLCLHALLCGSHLQDQALAVGEGLLGTETAPLPALSPRRHRIGQTCLRVADGAGRLLKMMHPGKQWGAAATAGRRAGAPGGVEVEAARRLNRMASLQRAASSIPSI